MVIMLLVVMIGPSPGRPAHAQVPEGDPNNAATWYRAALDAYRAVQFDMQLYEHSAAFEADPDRGPTAEARRYLQRYREAINLTKRAARRTHCDLGPFETWGDAPPLIATYQLRRLVSLLRNEYRMHVFDGRHADAVSNICAVVRISRHAATQQALMPTQIGAAMLKSADFMIAHAIDRAILGPNEATRVLRELDQLKGKDPYGMAAAVLLERERVPEEIRMRYAGDNGIQRLRDDLLPYYRQENDERSIAAIETMTPADLQQQIIALEALFDRLQAAFDAGDDVMLDRAQEEIKLGEHGALARFYNIYHPSLPKFIDSTRTLLDDRRTTLRGIIDGSIDPHALANAACWYISAGVKLDRIDPDVMTTIDAAAGLRDPAAINRDQLEATLRRDDVREVIESLNTASKIERCDFSYAKPYWTVLYRPYHASVLACGRLLFADAMLHAREGRIDEAVDRLSQMLLLSSRIAGDGVIAGSLSAFRIFIDAHELAALLHDRSALDKHRLEAIRAGVNRFARGDPFHFESAIAAMRQPLSGWFSWFLCGAPHDTPRYPEDYRLQEDAAALLSTLSADQILALQAISEQWLMHQAPPDRPVRSPITGLWPILDVEAFERSRAMLPTIIQWAREGVIGNIGQADLPIIVPLEDRMRAAMDVYRESMRRFGATESLQPSEQP